MGFKSLLRDSHVLLENFGVSLEAAGGCARRRGPASDDTLLVHVSLCAFVDAQVRFLTIF